MKPGDLIVVIPDYVHTSLGLSARPGSVPGFDGNFICAQVARYDTCLLLAVEEPGGDRTPEALVLVNGKFGWRELHYFRVVTYDGAP